MRGDSASALRARGLRVTPQRRAILDAFDARPEEHLSADEIHARAAAAVPEISRGTVYAALAELTELGLLSALGSPEPVRYETNTRPHQHFRCRLCLRLFDVEIPTPDVRGLARHGFAVDRVSVAAEGVCADCGDYDRGLHDGADAVRTTAQLGNETLATVAGLSHDTEFGPVLIAASPDGIVRIVFEGLADFTALFARARSRKGPRAARARADALAGSLDAYLAGGREAAADVVDWGLVPGTTRAVLEAVRAIPYGEQRSYDRVCGAASAYDCGFAMGSNPFPLLVPCHRVTRGSQMPTAYVGGNERRLAINGFEHAHL